MKTSRICLLLASALMGAMQAQAGAALSTPRATANDVFALPAAPGAAPIAGTLRSDAEPEAPPVSPGSAPPGVRQRSTSGGPATSARSVATTATITGSVFYNDRRTDSLFAARLDKSGNPGQRCSISGTRDNNGPACSLNWLVGKYMVVDVIEHDEGFLPTGVNCKKEDVLTSATVANDGSFSATFSTADPCKHDKLANVAIELRVRLKTIWKFTHALIALRAGRSGGKVEFSHPDSRSLEPPSGFE